VVNFDIILILFCKRFNGCKNSWVIRFFNSLLKSVVEKWGGMRFLWVVCREVWGIEKLDMGEKLRKVECCDGNWVLV
jgi:hypothetical protein